MLLWASGTGITMFSFFSLNTCWAEIALCRWCSWKHNSISQVSVQHVGWTTGVQRWTWTVWACCTEPSSGWRWTLSFQGSLKKLSALKHKVFSEVSATWGPHVTQRFPPTLYVSCHTFTWDKIMNLLTWPSTHIKHHIQRGSVHQDPLCSLAAPTHSDRKSSWKLWGPTGQVHHLFTATELQPQHVRKWQKTQTHSVCWNQKTLTLTKKG